MIHPEPQALVREGTSRTDISSEHVVDIPQDANTSHRSHDSPFQVNDPPQGERHDS